MNTHKAFWQMITFSPWLYALNVLLQLFRSTFLLLPGLIVFALFNVLTANKPVGWDLWTLGALLAGQAMKSGSFSVGSLALFVAYLDEIARFTAGFFRIFTMYKQAGISLQRLQSALPAGVPRSTVVAHAPVYLSAAYPEVPAPQRQTQPLKQLEIRGLTYRYAQSGRGIEQIDLQLQRGTCTIITGRIGSGNRQRF